MALCCPTAARAQGAISDGSATYEYTGFGLGNVDFTVDGGTDQAFEQWWWYRLVGDTSETALPTPDAESYVGNVATLSWSDLAGTGLDVTVVTTLAATSASAASVTHELTVHNTNASPVTMALFAYADLEVGGTSAGDSATSVSATEMTVTDSASISFVGPGADAYQVEAYPDLRDALDDAATTTLSSTGLPFGPGDWSGAYEWDLSIPAGATQTVTVSNDASLATGICGNGTVETGETCDDGYTDACGSCNATCDAAGSGSTCGDGVVCTETEECDDGNTADGDGCSAACTVEAAVDAGAPITDAGTSSDAGGPVADAGTPSSDAGAPMTDAGTSSDAGGPVADAGMAGTDAGASSPDAGAGDGGAGGLDAGVAARGERGCSCRLASRESSERGPLVAFVVLGVLWLRRRSGRRRR